MRPRRRRPLTALEAFDADLFDTVARAHSPLVDATMPRLTRAADHSKLWFAIAGGLMLTGNTTARRAAIRGVGTIAVTSLLTNQVAKRFWQRARPVVSEVPLHRRARRLPTSNSWPSGHSASAAAFATAVGIEHRRSGLALGPLAGLVGFSRVATGAHYPGDVATGLALGSGIALLGAMVFPPRSPDHAAPAQPAWTPAPATRDGAGLIIVLNPSSGSGTGERVHDTIVGRLPRAEIIVVDDVDEIASALDDAADRADILGVAGGDGTVSAAAAVAVEHGLPLAVFPAGTFNHFARDVGCPTADATADALQAGTARLLDMVSLNDSRLILNTASIGAYPHFVRTRMKLEASVKSRRLAAPLALIQSYRRAPRIRIRFDGADTVVSTSLFLVGNAKYLPSGFSSAQANHVDDGLLDVRILDHDKRWATARLIGALLTGDLRRSGLYHELHVPEFSFTAVDGPTVIAHDGEIGDEYQHTHFRVLPRALTVYSPR